MANVLFTTADDGDWGDGSTWVGGVVPSPDDRVRLEHDVVVTDHQAIGTSPARAVGTPTAWDLDIAPSGSLTVAVGGRLTMRGHPLIRTGGTSDAAITINGTFEFDSTLAPTPATDGYALRHGDAYDQRRRINVGPGAVIRSVAGAARSILSSATVGAQWTHGEWLGTAENPIRVERMGWDDAPSIDFGGGNAAANVVRLHHVIFRDCVSPVIHVREDEELDWQHVSVLDPIDDYALRGGSYAINDPDAAVRQILHCRFDGHVSLTEGEARPIDGAAGIAFNDNVLGDGLTIVGGGFTEFKRNLYATAGWGKAPAGEVEDTYVFGPRDDDNAHIFSMGAGTVRGCVFDAPNDADADDGGPQSEGEFLPFLSYGGNLAVERCLFIPQKAVGLNVSAAEWLNDNAGHVTFDRCTIGVTVGGALSFGHAGDNGVTGDRASLTNSLILGFGPTTADSTAARWIASGTRSGAVAPMLEAKVHHNGLWRIANPYDVPIAPGETLGDGDVSGDPFPGWPTDPADRLAALPRLESWGRQVLGLAGTGAEVEDAAIAAMLASHDPTHPGHVSTAATPAALVAWVKTQWAPTNAAFATASSTGGTIGAVDYAEATSPLDDLEVGDTGAYNPSDPEFDPTDYITPAMGPDPFRSLRLSDSPLASLVRPTLGQPAHRKAAEVAAYFATVGQNVRVDSAEQDQSAGFPLTIAPADAPLVPIGFYGEDEAPEGAAVLPSVSDVTDAGWPIPPTTRVQGHAKPYPPTTITTGDRHICVVNEGTGDVHEAYNANKDPEGDGWTIANGWVYNLLTGDWAPNITDPDDPRYVPPGTHRYPNPLVNAAGLPMLPLMVRYEELYVHGRIKHKIGCTFDNRKIGGTAIWPALGVAYQNIGRVDGSQGPPIPYGATLRLKAAWYRANVQDFTVGTDADGFPEITHVGEPIGDWEEGCRVLLRGFLEYGLINTDGGNQGAFWMAADSRIHTENRYHGDIKALFFGVPLAEFEMVDHVDDEVRIEVDPPQAETGVQREITVHCDYWTNHPAAHPGNETFGYGVAIVEAGTGIRRPMIAPGETWADADGVIARLTPDRPYARFLKTPAADEDNWRCYPMTYPFGLPWDYFAGTWKVDTNGETAAITIPRPTVGGEPQPLTFYTGIDNHIAHTVTGIGAAQAGLYWGTTFGDAALTQGFVVVPGAGSGEATAWLAADQSVSKTVPFIALEGPPPDPDPDPPPVGGGRSRRRRRLLLARRRAM